ncbi:MAG TPA: GerMN domain-containing protein [Acidimicrobiales bacterium]|nr:GerMN domain-containing protein [Acidimicrobiales bacterium]
MGRHRSLAALLLGVALLAGCGVQGDSAPRALAPESVPEELLAPSTSTVEPDAPTTGAVTTVYLVDNRDRLRPVLRSLPSPVLITGALGSLLEGATDEEADEGLRSEVPTGTTVIGIDRLDEDVIAIDLSEDFAETTADGELLAQAQIVYTVSELPNVRGVLFLVDGRPREGADDDAKLTSAPLTVEDFEDFAPPAGALP